MLLNYVLDGSWYLGSKVDISSLKPALSTIENGLRSVAINFPIAREIFSAWGELTDIFTLTASCSRNCECGMGFLRTDRSMHG